MNRSATRVISKYNPALHVGDEVICDDGTTGKIIDILPWGPPPQITHTDPSWERDEPECIVITYHHPSGERISHRRPSKVSVQKMDNIMDNLGQEIP